MSQPSIRNGDAAERTDHAEAIEKIRRALDRLKFGAIHLTVHEGRLVQIEITEKTRLTA
jgi:hypothetical protein